MRFDIFSLKPRFGFNNGRLCIPNRKHTLRHVGIDVFYLFSSGLHLAPA